MVQFLTTTYTHMYGNSYTGRPNYGRGKRTMVGHRVEKMRKSKGLSIGEVCTAVKVAPSVYDSFLDGRYRFDRDQMKRLADVLGVTVYDLFHAKGGDTSVGKSTRKAKPAPSKMRVSRLATPAKGKSVKPSQRKQAVKPKDRPYDADAAADLLSKKFKVTRSR